MTEAAVRRPAASPGGSGNNIVSVSRPVLAFLRSPRRTVSSPKRTDYGGGLEVTEKCVEISERSSILIRRLRRKRFEPLRCNLLEKLVALTNHPKRMKIRFCPPSRRSPQSLRVLFIHSKQPHRPSAGKKKPQRPERGIWRDSAIKIAKFGI